MCTAVLFKGGYCLFRTAPCVTTNCSVAFCTGMIQSRLRIAQAITAHGDHALDHDWPCPHFRHEHSVGIAMLLYPSSLLQIRGWYPRLANIFLTQAWTWYHCYIYLLGHSNKMIYFWSPVLAEFACASNWTRKRIVNRVSNTIIAHTENFYKRTGIPYNQKYWRGIKFGGLAVYIKIH